MWISIGDRLRLLSLLLRVGALATSAAFLAVFLPVEWMAATHEALGLGPFPRAPLVDYLARSIALLYGFHGILMFIVAGDPVRYRPIVTYIAAMDLIFGVAIAIIDIHAGMPWYWTIGESVPITVMGVLIAVLDRSTRAAPMTAVA
ncbi:MAG: hypothetical protein H0W18_13815 [Acidobacteria bacterium]|nr:hypothetical protein [Acidobacteriota bacterium]